MWCCESVQVINNKSIRFCAHFLHLSITFFVAGKPIENDPAIDRLIEIRTVLEKIRPIDYKLRYQIDKLVKTAITGTSNSFDPNTFKVCILHVFIECRTLISYCVCVCSRIQRISFHNCPTKRRPAAVTVNRTPTNRPKQATRKNQKIRQKVKVTFMCRRN